MTKRQHKQTWNRSLFFLFILLLSSVHHAVGEEAVWAPETTLEVKAIGNVDVSPSGKQVVYTVTEVVEAEETSAYVTQIWKGKVGNRRSHHQLTTEEKSSSYPRWSPDGKWIAFLSSRSGGNNLFLVSAKSGKTVQLTDLKQRIQTFRWSPDGSAIAFVAKNEEEPSSKNHPNLSDEVQTYPNSRGVSHLFVVSTQPSLQTPEVLTTNAYNVVGEIDFGSTLEAFDWSPDNKKIAFTYTPEVGQDSRWKRSQIALININSKEIETLPKCAPHQSIPKFSPNGELLAFLKSDKDASYSLTRTITLYSFSTGEFRELQKTPNEASFLVGPSLLGWSRDGDSVLYLEPLRTKFAIWSIPIDEGEMVRVDDGNWTFHNPLLSSNRKWIGIPLETSDTAPEAYVTTSSTFSPKKVSTANESLKKWKMSKTEVICWKSQDGQEVEGLLTYPKNYTPGTSYPLLLVIHGGPMGVSSDIYLGKQGIYPLAAFADAGFAVLRANPRGSCGYGRAFRYAVCSDWGGGDFQDLMSGVNSLIDQGIVDSNRMGVMGWSYGGYMTAWIISQTDRFSAASMGAGVSNLLSIAGTTDVHHFLSDYFGGEIWETTNLYLERSPIMHAEDISTPLLIQHGEEDGRVPFSQSVELYNSLRKAKKPVIFAVYPRTPHRILEPKLHLDALQRNFDWFVKHVKNKNLENNKTNK